VENFPLKYGKFGPFFNEKSCVEVEIAFFLFEKSEKLPIENH